MDTASILMNTTEIEKIDAFQLKNHLKSVVNDRAALIPWDMGTSARYAIGGLQRWEVVWVRCDAAVTEKAASETKQGSQFRVRTVYVKFQYTARCIHRL